MGASAQLVILADHPKLQQLYAHRLREHGYRVETASSIDEAIVAAIVRRPGLLISEWLLGHGHGLELSSRLHAVAAVAATPILFLTDEPVLPLTLQRGEHGPIDLLVRPFPFERLRDAIERMMTSGTVSNGARGAAPESLTVRARAVINDLVESGLLARREAPDDAGERTSI
ncbi:MAG TPA: response regulator [Nitrospiria bacterium]|nr:response regulator [Nitrospiria bacterium]